MPTIRRPGKRLPHLTLTGTGARAARALQNAGLLPYPGLINPKRSRSAHRVVITAEPNRVKIAVAGEGIQELMVYGTVTPDQVIEALTVEFGHNAVVVRDPHGLWSS